MLKKFPFDDGVLRGLVILDPGRRADTDYSSIVSLANKFCPNVNLEELKEEYEDYQLLEDCHIPLQDESGSRKAIDKVWSNILQMKPPMGQVRFPVLRKVMHALLCLPHSNADCERVFSQVRKIHTDCRKNLNSDTLTALLQCKLNSDACCDIQPSGPQVDLAKNATYAYNSEHK
ncbi:uncharacterized protein LOC124253022 [Haliotis rubra]|uniref:uncharacterized protein LOC124253022 n=1 Tax=Haliotis rubra TaxID=36100 RepID=UPI001EE611A8|nr:uncharacterized protein LOC124253022 [Haliotis rubra]